MRPSASHIAIAALVAGCAGPGAVGEQRFANQEVVWTVDDRRDTTTGDNGPAEYDHLVSLYYYDQYFYVPLMRGTSAPRGGHARNVNALDEVPDSTWFTNRIGLHELTPEQVAIGPNATGGPDPSEPWTIKSTKIGGAAIGFIIEDARGDRFILKFDEKGEPQFETGADAVVQRLLWAIGYHVPEDTVVYFTRDQLRLADDAKKIDRRGHKSKLTERDLDRALTRVDVSAGGRYRGLASKFLPGKPIGGFAQLGTREGDVNDVIPHQHRRELRGLYAVYSWLQATDVKTDNTLDMLVEDPTRPDHHYVMHYLVDFGKSLGVNGWVTEKEGDGHIHNFDFAQVLPNLLSFGLRVRPWEGQWGPGIPGVGQFDAEHYRPGHFKTRSPYYAWAERDTSDMLWATKIILRLAPAHIRAAVAQGRYEDPRAVDYLTDTLVERQKILGRYWLTRVNPLDRFEVRPGDVATEASLCFADLLLAYELASARDSTRYVARAYSFAGDELAWTLEASPREQPAGRSGITACMDGLRPGPSHAGYVILRITTSRGNWSQDAVLVHLAKHPETGALHVIGIRRR